MPGLRRIPRNNVVRRLPGHAILFLLVTALGCGGTKQAERPAQVPQTPLAAFILPFEKNFHPSKYDDDLQTVKEHELKQAETFLTGEMVNVAPPETIPGFRVQVLLTKEIDEANAVNDRMGQDLPDESVYLVYDSPYYKIRIGNFLDRPSADATLRKVVNLGYKDAWVVPDNVLKNPPPKLPDSTIEIERPIKNKN